SALESKPRLDVVGGLLLFVGLSAVIAGLFNPDPSKSVLPPWGAYSIAGGLIVLGAFVVWEVVSPTRLLDPAGIDTQPFLAARGTNVLAGAALMISLVDVPLVAQPVLDRTALGGALFLSWFLIGLPVGALLGGWLTVRTSERMTAVLGMALS